MQMASWMEVQELRKSKSGSIDVYNGFRIELARNEEYTTVFTYDRKRQILEIDRTWSGGAA